MTPYDPAAPGQSFLNRSFFHRSSQSVPDRMNFSELGLSDELLRAVIDAGYTTPTPIQREAIPHVLRGRDVLGCAQTGTGKTASFTLPMIEVLAAGRARARMPRSLILEPTRELAAQVAQNFDTYGKYFKLTKALIIGGVSMDDQMRILDRGVDVLIATPGRLLDVFARGHLLLSDVKILVIDEADRMLDMGFIPDVEKIVGLLSRIRQTLFFSATMPQEIRRLADSFLINPKEVTVSPPSTPSETVTQGLVMLPTPRERGPGAEQKDKRAALRGLINREQVKNALVFCNRKRDIGVLHRSLTRHGLNAGQLHGDMPQSARTETLANFKAGKITFLVCSDVAARGLDVAAMSHVFNFDVPTHAEDYIHRIGRTGRAGHKGRAFTIATPADRKYLSSIEKLIGSTIPLTTETNELEPASVATTIGAPSEENLTPAQNDNKNGEEQEKRPRRRQRGSRVGAARIDTTPVIETCREEPLSAPILAKEPAPTTKTTDAPPNPTRDDSKNGEEQEKRPRRRQRGGRVGAAIVDTTTAIETRREEPLSAPILAKEPPGGDPANSEKKGSDRNRGNRNRRDDETDNRPVLGMGDHMPEFMTRAVKLPKA